MKHILSIFFIGMLFTLLLSNCKSATDKKNNQTKQYFDISKFINQEIAKLTQKNPKVLKSTATEQRTLHIKNWNDELTIFSDADINKTAWIGYFKTLQTDSSVQYLALKEEIPVKKVIITFDQQKNVKHLEILSKEKNWLYQSIDTLIFIPDSTYRIIKWQKTRFLSESSYHIEGQILK